jgi:probable HAF family extracellular repeat protein
VVNRVDPNNNGTHLLAVSTDARGINDAGRVVGSSGTAGGISHVFITGSDGMGMRDLGTLGGAYSFAYGINDAGRVVGSSGTAGGISHAFITGPDGMGMRDIGTLGAGGLYDFSWASGINEAGQVVGGSNTGGAADAFITGPNGAGMMDLNSLVDVPRGVILTQATGINNAGQVVAYATIPEPKIYALFLAGLALSVSSSGERRGVGEPLTLG